MVERKFPRDFIPSLIEEEEEEEERQKYRIHDFQRNFSRHLSATGAKSRGGHSRLTNDERNSCVLVIARGFN